MANKQLLLRDNLSDIGTIPSSGSYYMSPDLIVHDQVANAQEFFASNYDKDVNKKIEIGSGFTYIYARVKNLSDQDHIANVHLYASTPSLFMTPSKWKKNKVRSYEGNLSIPTESIPPNGIGVISVPFIFNPKTSTNYCHVGYVSDDNLEPDIPSDEYFSSYSKFVNWLHLNPHICLRNFWAVSSRESSFDLISEYSNPTKDSIVGVFKITLQGEFPVGTELIVKSASIGLDETFKVTELKEKTIVPPMARYIPSEVSAFLGCSLYSPGGSEWPEDGYMTVEFLVEEDYDGEAYHLSNSVDEIAPNHCSKILKGHSRLIKVGECSVQIIKDI